LTENEQKQQLSVAYVHAVAARAGYTCQVKTVDEESVDVEIGASGYLHQQAVLRSPRIEVQLKATSSPQLKTNHLTFRLPSKNYRDLRETTMIPRLLVVLILPKKPAEWIELSEECMISRRCAYWVSLLGRDETSNVKTVSISLPRSHLFNVDQLRELMERVARKESL
jgi:hypothetical protein